MLYIVLFVVHNIIHAPIFIYSGIQIDVPY
jgi:hypothetical protein